MREAAARLLEKLQQKGLVNDEKINKIKSEIEAEMFNLFKHKPPQNVKQKLYSEFPEFCLIFREGALDEIKRIKGIKSDAALAAELGLTRQYICNLRAQKAAVTSTVITRIAWLVGNIEKNWWIFYELRYQGIKKTNEMQYNEEKYLGQIPYEQFSTSVEQKKLDYKNVETKKNT